MVELINTLFRINAIGYNPVEFEFTTLNGLTYKIYESFNPLSKYRERTISNDKEALTEIQELLIYLNL